MKKTVPIEKLLRWAYCDELPKELTWPGFLRPEGFRSPGANLVRTGDLGQTIQEPDIRNRYGVVPDFTADGAPHSDALALWHAVQRLEVLQIDLPEDWNPIADLGELGPLGEAAIVKGIGKACLRDRNGVLWLRRPVHQLVESHVILGKVPNWRADTPEEKFVRRANGEPRWFIRAMTESGIEVEADGFDSKARRPKAGAYRKPYLDPDPADAVAERVHYRVFHAALGCLVDDLAGRLDEHEPLPTARSAEPWIDGDAAAARILVDPRPAQPLTRLSRPLAGPPPFRPITVGTRKLPKRAKPESRESTPALACDVTLTHRGDG